MLALPGEAGVVEDRGHPPALVLDGGGNPPLWEGFDRRRPSLRVDVTVLVRHPVDELQRGVTKRLRESIAQRPPPSAAAKPRDERAHRLGLAVAGAHQADQERK